MFVVSQCRIPVTVSERSFLLLSSPCFLKLTQLEPVRLMLCFPDLVIDDTNWHILICRLRADTQVLKHKYRFENDLNRDSTIHKLCIASNSTGLLLLLLCLSYGSPNAATVVISWQHQAEEMLPTSQDFEETAQIEHNSHCTCWLHQKLYLKHTQNYLLLLNAHSFHVMTIFVILQGQVSQAIPKDSHITRSSIVLQQVIIFMFCS